MKIFYRLSDDEFIVIDEKTEEGKRLSIEYSKDTSGYMEYFEYND